MKKGFFNIKVDDNSGNGDSPSVKTAGNLLSVFCSNLEHIPSSREEIVSVLVEGDGHHTVRQVECFLNRQVEYFLNRQVEGFLKRQMENFLHRQIEGFLK